MKFKNLLIDKMCQDYLLALCLISLSESEKYSSMARSVSKFIIGM